MTLEQRIARLEGLLSQLIASDRYVFHKHIQMLDGRNVQLGLTTGTKIGLSGGSTGEKIGLWGTTPVVQPSAIADVAGGLSDSDGTARAKINSILAALRLPGFIDT